MKNLAAAVLAVMKEVKGIDKTMTVGTGSNSYKGVSDKEVKKIIGECMAKNGLVILPIETHAKVQIDRWEETNQYGLKQKQSAFTEVETKYLLLHESGESQVISGYGHGVDSQDKGAGKATTYALKYALLYTFMVPTGTIDDADTTHSDEKEIPTKKEVVKEVPKKVAPVKKSELLPETEPWKGAITYLIGGGTIDMVEKKYTISPKNREKLLAEAI